MSALQDLADLCDADKGGPAIVFSRAGNIGWIRTDTAVRVELLRQLWNNRAVIATALRSLTNEEIAR